MQLFRVYQLQLPFKIGPYVQLPHPKHTQTHTHTDAHSQLKEPRQGSLQDAR